MRRTGFVLFALLALVLSAAACGDDDDGGGNPDAASSGPDAALSPADAGPPDAVAAEGFGKVCGNHFICQAIDPEWQCLSQSQSSGGWCTFKCWENADPMNEQPGPTENALCADAYDGENGFAVCGIYNLTPNSSGLYDWYCGLFCGDGTDHTCPGGLECQTNWCDK